MQISGVNSMNFKGVWEIKNVGQKMLKAGFGDWYNINYQDAIYHPFKDETPEEIAKNISKEIEGEVWEDIDKDGYKYFPYSAEITRSVIQGERLDKTKAEFEEDRKLVKQAEEYEKRHDPGYGQRTGWEKSKYTSEEYIEQIGKMPGRKIEVVV